MAGVLGFSIGSSLSNTGRCTCFFGGNGFTCGGALRHFGRLKLKFWKERSRMTQLLNKAKKEPVLNEKRFSLGIGLTNECDLSCAHCYRSQLKLDRLSLEEVQKVCQAVPVGSVSLGV